MTTGYKEKRIGLISCLRIGVDDRSGDKLAITFSVVLGESSVCSLGVYGQEAADAIVAAGYEDISRCRACYCVSLEKDGAWGTSCLVGFAGFVKAGTVK